VGFNAEQADSSAIDRTAEQKRALELARVKVEAKLALRDYDVFMCYNAEDREGVERLASRLKDRGVLPWLDRWDLKPGMPWQFAMEERAREIKSLAICVGPHGLAPWEDREIRAVISTAVQREIPVIPVLLPGVHDLHDAPVFLREFQTVAFKGDVTELLPLDNLIWAITGEHPSKAR